MCSRRKDTIDDVHLPSHVKEHLGRSDGQRGILDGEVGSSWRKVEASMFTKRWKRRQDRTYMTASTFSLQALELRVTDLVLVDTIYMLLCMDPAGYDHHRF